MIGWAPARIFDGLLVTIFAGHIELLDCSTHALLTSNGKQGQVHRCLVQRSM
jgi:hypothetical protein